MSAGTDYSKTWGAIPTPKRPHRCPICDGRGTVPAGFYGVVYTTNPVACRACGGRGIVIA